MGEWPSRIKFGVDQKRLGVRQKSGDNTRYLASLKSKIRQCLEDE
jgi:hypothetical protein